MDRIGYAGRAPVEPTIVIGKDCTDKLEFYKQTKPKLKNMKVLFISACMIEDGLHVAKGTIREYDEKSSTHQPVLRSLRAAGRIAPVTKDNVARCIDELEKEQVKAKARKEQTVAVPDELLAASNELGVERSTVRTNPIITSRTTGPRDTGSREVIER
jgi:hypothetical protein